MKGLAIGLCLFWAAAYAGEVSLTITPKQARVGDQIEIRAVIKTAPDIDRVELSFPGDGMETILRQNPPSRLFQGSRIFEKTTVVAFFEVGTFPVGPFAVSYFRGQEKVSSETLEPQSVTIQSVLTDSDKDIAGLKAPLGIRGNPRYLLIYVLIVFLAAVLVFLAIYFWRRRRRTAPDRVPLSLEEEFARRIALLLDSRLHARGEFREFFIQLTDSIKWFLNCHYGFPAEDYTSWETIQALSDREREAWIPERIRHLFDVADEVKFARISPQPDSLEMVIHDVSGLVSEYRRRKKVVEEAQHADAGK